MRSLPCRTVLLFWVLLRGSVATAAFADEPGTARPVPDRPVVLAHYMPWFEAPPLSPRWGWHWTMNVFDPDSKAAGRRRIASHYDPVIGPYDSCDPAVLEYHLLLMKLAGIDGVVADWYGLGDHFDYPVIHRNVGRLFEMAARLGLKVAICYEDQTIPKLVEAGKLAAGDRVTQARSDLAWLHSHWFRDPGYVRLDGRPLLLSFGDAGLTDAEWGEVLSPAEPRVTYLSEHHRRPAAQGAFDWPHPASDPASRDRFYEEVAAAGGPFAAVAFPRFQDIYAEAKVQPGHPPIPDADGRTWVDTFTRALRSGAPVVQVATWNDWGEGTVLEPSVQFGTRDLEVLQRLRFAEVPATGRPVAADLHLPLRLYRLRQRASPAEGTVATLDAIAQHLAAGRLADARAELDRCEIQP